ncbi:hypothetical protein [Streptomyces parvulus]
MLIKPDPATPEGRAILELAELMDGLQELTGEWPGADAADIVEGWLRRFTYASAEGTAPQPAGRAWVLRTWDRRTDDVALWADEASALASLAQEIRRSWDDAAGTEGFPFRPPADDQTIVDLYYGPENGRGDVGYTLFPADICRLTAAPRSLRLSDSDDCAAANSWAVFHPMDGPDGEGLPCTEIAGVLVFSYLDADREAVRVSVHLDTTDSQLLRADGTVPIVVEIGDTTVFDNVTPPPVPSGGAGWTAGFRRLVRRTRAVSGRRREGG